MAMLSALLHYSILRLQMLPCPDVAFYPCQTAPNNIHAQTT